MKSIEKSLTNFLKGTGFRVSEDELCAYASKSEKQANELIDILFNVVNDFLDNYNGVDSLDKERDLLVCISNVMLNSSDVNRGIVARRSHKLDYKLSHLLEENKNKIIDKDNAYTEIEKTRLAVTALEDQTVATETKQYDFVNYLVDAIKNIAYLEYSFNKMPSLVNAKDKEEICLFQNIVMKYMDSVRIGNEEDILYYSNLLSLIMSQKNFELSPKDKRKCLEVIYTGIDRLSVKKKIKKRNGFHIDFLNKLVDSIKGNDDKEIKIDELANKYNISVIFNSEIMCQLGTLKTKIGMMEDRIVVDDYTITIDKESAIEIDDALTCRRLPNGNYLLGVHIASVLAYFPYESEIVQEAINRNRSIYLPKKYQNKENDFDRVIPIFPYNFSACRASLIPGEERLTRSYFFEIDQKGDVVHEEFRKSIIKSDKKATYNEINEVLIKGSKDKQLQEVVTNLSQVTNLLDKKYKIEKIYEDIKENIDDFSDITVKNIGAEKIINKVMLLTGNRVASFFYNNNYPCLYRVHEVNEENIINLQSMIDNLNRTYGGGEYQKLLQLISGIYPKGWYATSGSHYGLGLDHYCHCTSGLRRSADIVVEHGLEICYDNIPNNNDLNYYKNEVEKRAIQINSKTSPIEWFIKDYKRAYQKRR
ncbi:MAG: RNB domain-containing ribonuclease [Bacilli bacterium]|nr:RNB domain-containing ribonuclease [Bacilli bacterium]